VNVVKSPEFQYIYSVARDGMGNIILGLLVFLMCIVTAFSCPINPTNATAPLATDRVANQV